MKTLKLFFALPIILLASKSDAQCNVVPYFTTSVTGNVLNCTNLSTGTAIATTYTWNFYLDANDPITSNSSSTLISSSGAINPATVTYTANGEYRVELIATNSSTCTPQTSTQTISICHYTPAITYTQTPGGVISFSTDAYGVGLKYTNWSFGDYAGSLNNPVSHTYFNGIYQSKLNVFFGYSSSCIFNLMGPVITVTDNPCDASAAFTYSTGTNGVVTFSTSTMASTNVVYFWNFGDGSISWAANPSHTYSSAGNYYIKMNCYNALGLTSCRDTSETNINITGIPCIADANFTLSPSGYPQTYYINPASAFNIANAMWTWGDGDTTYVSGSLYGGHAYAVAGNYNVCLTLTTTCGSTASFCVNQYLSKGESGNMVYVSVQPPPLSTSIEKNAIDNISTELFPNPSNSGIINLKLNRNAAISEIRVYDLIGKEVYSDKRSEELEIHSVDLSKLTNGIYFLQFKLPGKTVSSKFIISRM